MSALTEVTSVYVGYYRDEATLVLPYSFDEGTEGTTTGGNVQHYGPHGLAAWIRTSARPYRWDEDQGALIRRGASFGDSAPTADALVVPLLALENTRVIGLMAFLSSRGDAFTEDLVPVAEWIAQALCVAGARDEEEVEHLDLYALYPELNSQTASGSADILIQAEEHLRALRDGLQEVVLSLRSEHTGDALKQAVQVLDSCERSITDLAQSYATGPAEVTDPLSPLTDREREIALLISEEGLTNAAIAERLVISERTVKGHVGAVLRKLEVQQRSGIAWVLKTQ